MRIENLKSLIIIGLIVTFSLSSTYAYMQLQASNNSATGVGGCFEVDYVKGQAINASDLPTTTNYLSGASTEVTLSKADNCDIYTTAQIKLYTNTSTTAPLSKGALKYKVVKNSGDGTILSGGTGAVTANGEIQLASVSLTTTATTYTIYMWVDPTISIGYYDEKTYSGYIFAESIQQSTIQS